MQKNKASNFIRDVCDGQLYNDLLNSKDGKEILDHKAFTFIMNSDGIQLCQKSKKTIWPLFLAINELPIGERFCIDNVIIAGEI